MLNILAVNSKYLNFSLVRVLLLPSYLYQLLGTLVSGQHSSSGRVQIVLVLRLNNLLGAAIKRL